MNNPTPTPGTPLPWSLRLDHESPLIVGDCALVARLQRNVLRPSAGRCHVAEANAAYIVQACNAFPDLVAALQAAVQTLDECTDESRCEGHCAIHQARAALTKAGISNG